MNKNNSTAQPSCADSPEWREEWVPLNSIIQHGPLQVRNKLDASAVKRYASMTEAGRVPPPVKVGRLPNGTLYLIDGWHRIAAGALQTRDVHFDLEATGKHVLALVADLSEKEVCWQAARANMDHGVPLKPAEYRNVFRSYIRAGQHRKPNGDFKKYREIGIELGKGHTTVYQWTRRYFPALAERIGGVEHGNAGASQPSSEVTSMAEEHRQEGLKAAQQVLQGLPAMTPQGRREVAEALRLAVEEASRLGLGEADSKEEF